MSIKRIIPTFWTTPWFESGIYAISVFSSNSLKIRVIQVKSMDQKYFLSNFLIYDNTRLCKETVFRNLNSRNNYQDQQRQDFISGIRSFHFKKLWR